MIEMRFLSKIFLQKDNSIARTFGFYIFVNGNGGILNEVHCFTIVIGVGVTVDELLFFITLE